VDGARADDDEEALLLVAPLDDLDGFIAAVQDGALGLLCLRDLVLQEVGRGQRVVALDAPVLAVLLVAGILVLLVELAGLSVTRPAW
jgi:hypothetical protein